MTHNLSTDMDIQRKPRPWYVRYRPHILACAALAALCLYALSLALGPRKQRIRTEDIGIYEVREQPFTEYVDVEGLVQPIRTVRLNALEGGYVERILAEEGAMLREGDTILLLSNPDLLRSIIEEQAEWENRQRGFREQEIEMEQHSLTLRQQALDASHQMQSLRKSLLQSREEWRMGIKSKAELEVLEEDYEYRQRKVELQLQSLRHDSVATRLKRETVEANRKASMRKLSHSAGRIDRLTVRATADGQLSYLNAALGQQVQAGQSVGEIKVLTQYKVKASLSEYYIDRIAIGLPASIQQRDSIFPLSISKVLPEVKDRNFDCELVFTSARPSNIRLGKSYRVQIELGQPEPALVIPRGDFYQSTSGRWIYRLSPDGRTARRTPVEIGRQNPAQYEVRSGLRPGDRVIVSGYDKLGDAEELVIK